MGQWLCCWKCAWVRGTHKMHLKSDGSLLKQNKWDIAECANIWWMNEGSKNDAKPFKQFTHCISLTCNHSAARRHSVSRKSLGLQKPSELFCSIGCEYTNLGRGWCRINDPHEVTHVHFLLMILMPSCFFLDTRFEVYLSVSSSCWRFSCTIMRYCLSMSV